MRITTGKILRCPAPMLMGHPETLERVIDLLNCVYCRFPPKKCIEMISLQLATICFLHKPVQDECRAIYRSVFAVDLTFQSLMVNVPWQLAPGSGKYFRRYNSAETCWFFCSLPPLKK